jgi:hypothetical protein
VNAAENEISAWPNPNDGTFSIKLTSFIDEEAHIVITNIIGEKIKEFTVATNNAAAIKLDAADGVYFINAISAHGRWNAKVLVNH